MTDPAPLVQSPSVDVATQPVDFRDLFAREVSYVYATMRRLGVRESDLPDQTQEVFATVHALLDDFDRSRPVRPWLFGIAYRVASRYKRLACNAREVPSEIADDALLDKAPHPEQRALHAEEIDVAIAALQSIALSRRGVFVMSEIDGVPVPEIARSLDIPVNTAYSRLRLARGEFAAALARLRAAADGQNGRSRR